MSSNAYHVYGMNQSYFTRKITGYLDYKDIPWRLCRFSGNNIEVMSAGWPGGIPAVKTPDGEFMWDSTPIIHHLEGLFPEPSILPTDPVQRFLCYILEDAADEWFYRAAVGSRWFFEENTRHGGFELARDATFEGPLTCDQACTLVTEIMTSCCEQFGVTEENAQSWIDEILRPWLRVFGNHLEDRPYLFGERPSLADFALYGGNMAHFINDPQCRRWIDADGPAVVKHTHNITQPWDHEFGGWAAAEDVPETLIAMLKDLGRFYLPWVSRAAKEGSAALEFESGQSIIVEATDFLKEARGVLLARYLDLRSEALDAVLDRAGILGWFADYTDQAGTIPDYKSPPRPSENDPFPSETSMEEMFEMLINMGVDPSTLVVADG
jgi:glutathione S-transferase